MRILVNNIQSTNSTLLVKLLKRIRRFQVEVWGTAEEKHGFIASSTFVDRYFQAPDMSDDTSYLQFLQTICNRNSIDLIFVSSDKELRFMSRHKAEINALVIIPPAEVVALFQDKLMASLAVQQLGVGIPAIHADLFGKGKVIFRKKCSVSSTGIYVADLAEATYIENHFNADWFAQEYLVGNTYVADVFTDQEGVPKLIVPRRKIETQSGSTFRSQIVRHEQIIEACECIYSHYLIPGLSDIEFIENETGLYFIELNLRIGGSATASVIASFNYIEQCLEHFVAGAQLKGMDTYMDCVAWNSVVSRFYEETIV